MALISELLQLNLSDEVDYSKLLGEFAEKMSRLARPATQILGYFWLAISGKYLSEYWLARFSSEFELQPGGQSLLLTLEYGAQCQPVLLLTAVQVELVTIPKDCLILDVSHTLYYEYNSGIQRVLRKTVGQLLANGKKLRLVVFNEALNALEVLGDEAGSKFATFTKGIDERNLGSVAQSWKARFRIRKDHSLGYEILRLIYSCLMLLTDFLGGRSQMVLGLRKDLQAVARYLVRKQIVLLTLFRSKKKSSRKVLVPCDNSVLQMEVILELPRIEMFMASKKAFQYKLTMICYDLIPLIHPEFCVVSGPFVNYLRLLKVANRLSFISQTSQMQFEKFIQLLELARAKPQGAVHLLAGNFSTNREPKRLVGQPMMLLCVGTIEPRKNQLGILRAARLLWQEGLRFRLVFAGSIGWLYEAFAQELQEAQGLGIAFEHVVSPSESNLADLYAECSATIFCSFAEGYGLPVSESLAFGRPCITSNLGSMKEIADREGGCLLVEPGSIAQIAGTIRQVITEPLLLAGLVSSIRHLQESSWDRYALEIYEYSL